MLKLFAQHLQLFHRRGHDGFMETTRGQLLVATPLIDAGTFFRAVVLVLNHDEDGALGVILNRPLNADIEEFFPNITELVSSPMLLFQGGPVDVESALAVGILQGDQEPIGWQTMVGNFGLVDLAIPSALVSKEIQGVRVFAGYAGWSAGQLEAEIDEGSWLVVSSRPDDLVNANPKLLWQEVLNRQTGEVRLYASFPDDPNLN